jgi:hypothetical protein
VVNQSDPPIDATVIHNKLSIGTFRFTPASRPYAAQFAAPDLRKLNLTRWVLPCRAISRVIGRTCPMLPFGFLAADLRRTGEKEGSVNEQLKIRVTVALVRTGGRVRHSIFGDAPIVKARAPRRTARVGTELVGAINVYAKPVGNDHRPVRELRTNGS